MGPSGRSIREYRCVAGLKFCPLLPGRRAKLRARRAHRGGRSPCVWILERAQLTRLTTQTERPARRRQVGSRLILNPSDGELLRPRPQSNWETPYSVVPALAWRDL